MKAKKPLILAVLIVALLAVGLTLPAAVAWGSSTGSLSTSDFSALAELEPDLWNQGWEAGATLDDDQRARLAALQVNLSCYTYDPWTGIGCICDFEPYVTGGLKALQVDHSTTTCDPYTGIGSCNYQAEE